MNWKKIHEWSRPAHVYALLQQSRGPALLCGWLLMVVGMASGLWAAPPDYLQGDAARLMYVHVPTAWLSMAIYLLIAACALSAIVWHHVTAALLMRASIPVGLLMTGLCLVTGMIWGMPTWGTHWVWDARLTSVLVLFFLYFGLWGVTHTLHELERADKMASILALLGVVNLPIIKFSVDWWNTLHQPASISRLSMPSIEWSMLWPLLVVTIGLMAVVLACIALRYEAVLLARKIAYRRAVPQQQSSAAIIRMKGSNG